MPGRVFVAYTGDPQSDHELPSKPYIDAVGALVSTHDSRHQALSNQHGTTRAALQQLIANVHGTGTTLPDGASAFVPVASELDNYTTKTDTIETTLAALATKDELTAYVKFTDLSTLTVQTATKLSPGGSINGQAFTGQETITIDAVSPTTLQSTVATLATKQDVLDYVPSAAVSTATVQTATLLAPGGTIHGQLFTGGENITAKTLTPGDHLFGDAYNGSAAAVWQVDAKEDAEANTVPIRTGTGDIKAVKFIGVLQGQAESAIDAMQLGGKDASQFVTQTVLDTALQSVSAPGGVTVQEGRPSPPWQARQVVLSPGGLEVFDGTSWRSITFPEIEVEQLLVGADATTVLRLAKDGKLYDSYQTYATGHPSYPTLLTSPTSPPCINIPPYGGFVSIAPYNKTAPPLWNTTHHILLQLNNDIVHNYIFQHSYHGDPYYFMVKILNGAVYLECRDATGIVKIQLGENPNDHTGRIDVNEDFYTKPCVISFAVELGNQMMFLINGVHVENSPKSLLGAVPHESINVDISGGGVGSHEKTHIFGTPGAGPVSFSGRVYAMQAVSGVQSDEEVQSVMQTYRDTFGYELLYQNS